VNTKGGGHAFIGLHLAKKLISQGHKVTILNDGDQVREAVLAAGCCCWRPPWGRVGHSGASPSTSPPPVRSCSQEKLKGKAPFSEYASLGAEVVWGSPTDPAAWPSAHYDVVYDNNGKDLDSCKPLIDHFKVRSLCLVCVCVVGDTRVCVQGVVLA
jgi:hypothetical protein